VIKEIVRESGWEDRMNEQKLYIAWDELMGPAVARRTEKIYLRNRKLYIHISSSALKHELNMQRSRIIERLREHSNMNLVEQVIIR
jgi:predicted nucleic acid-binding Zn ribbon protein